VSTHPRSAHFLRRSAAACVGAWLLAGGTADAAQAVLTYRGYLGGVPIGNAVVEVSLDGERYGMTADVETAGVLGWVYQWKTRAETTGTMAGGKPAPVRSTSDGLYNHKHRRLELGFRPEGVIVELADPPLDAPELDTRGVPTELTRGALDPLSHFLQFGMDVARAGRCEGSYPVFDGRRRFDLVYKAGTMVTQRTSLYAPNGGPALRCDTDMRRIAGWKRRPEPRDSNDPTAPELPGRVWLRPLPGFALNVPIRLEIETRVATLLLHLVDPILPPEP
jgi:hypothetical protein